MTKFGSATIHPANMAIYVLVIIFMPTFYAGEP
jgi:hypothetical protein